MNNVCVVKIGDGSGVRVGGVSGSGVHAATIASVGGGDGGSGIAAAIIAMAA